MRRVLILIGMVFLFAALAVGGHDLWVGLAEGPLVFRSLGEIWFAVSPGSLNLVQAVVQRYAFPELWDPWIVWILGQPAAADFGVLAAIFLLIGSAFHKRG